MAAMHPTTVNTLEAVHRDLIARFNAGDVGLEAVVESVPQLVALVERYVPEADAIILGKDELRSLVTAVVVEVLQTQARRSLRLSGKRMGGGTKNGR